MKKIEKLKKRYLKNIYSSKDMNTKLMWQNVYIWLIRNEDKFLTHKK